MTKICLINPPTTVDGAHIYFPMALVTLGAVLKEAGIDVEIVDFDLALRSPQNIRTRYASNYIETKENASFGACGYLPLNAFLDHAIRRLADTGADIFGISSISSNYPLALLLAREIHEKLSKPLKSQPLTRVPGTGAGYTGNYAENKDTDVWPKIILGGPQPSAVPEETLRACPWVDAIVIGEGEQSLRALVRNNWAPSSLRDIAGIACRDGGQVIVTPKRQPVADLDSLPFPDFSLVNLPDYLAINPEVALIEAGRGCPFQCAFCSTSLMWDRRFRMKSPGRILEEMRRLHAAYGLKDFGLTHDNFTASHRHLTEFCRFFQENNKEGFGWSVSARPDTLDSERLRSLDRAGCRGLYMGVDTGSDRMQRAIRKNLNLAKFREVLAEAVVQRIPVTTSFIVGYPEETEEDLNETVSLALWSKRTGAREIQIYRLNPHAGTAIYEQTRARLVFDGQTADASMQPVRDHQIDFLVATHPDLFSSFYTIPTPQHGSTNLLALAVFYDALINQISADAGDELEKLLDATGWTPTELFRRWWDWGTRTHPERIIEGPFIEETFPEFVVGEILPAVLSVRPTPLQRGAVQ